MPFIDLNQPENATVSEEFDVTIIGAGAAGVLLAVKLAQKGKKVLVIESGHFEVDEEKQKLNEVVNTRKILGSAYTGRNRGIGGTTLTWGGQSLPFSQLDFNKRDWVMNSGWPLAYDSMKEYYKTANAFMKIDTLNYHDDIFKEINLSDKQIDKKVFDFHVAKWANEPNFQTLYKTFLEKHVSVYYHAQLIKINQSDNKVTNIDVKNFNGQLFNFKINKLIVACGGIETIRTLLNNNIGNHSNWLGKCFMEHPCIELGDIFTDKSYKLQKTFNTHMWQRRKYSLRLSLSDHFQIENKLLNCSAGIMFTCKSDAFDPYAELKYFRSEFNLKSLIKLSGSLGSLIKSAWALLFQKFFFKDNTENKLVLMMEQEPDETSYIGLSDEVDQFGIPKAKISWHISKKSWDTTIACANALKKEIERLKYGKVKFYDFIKSDNEHWMDCLSDVNHHMGGARMSARPEDGVVNTDLQVWNIPNLFVCSCAVYPTSSHSNPTLTLLALGTRLTDFICKDDNIN